jgi:hypothetical protein
VSSDSSEIYYAEMEAARNSAWDAYQIARPHLLRSDHAREFQALFNAGFERAFVMLWHGGRAAQETSPAPADPDEETPCPKREDGMHCECWYGGNPCCGCGRSDILDGRAKPPCSAANR